MNPMKGLKNGMLFHVWNSDDINNNYAIGREVHCLASRSNGSKLLRFPHGIAPDSLLVTATDGRGVVGCAFLKADTHYNTPQPGTLTLCSMHTAANLHDEDHVRTKLVKQIIGDSKGFDQISAAVKPGPEAWDLSDMGFEVISYRGGENLFALAVDAEQQTSTKLCDAARGRTQEIV